MFENLDILLMLTERLDTQSALAFFRSSKMIHEKLTNSDSFWFLMCNKAGFNCLELDHSEMMDEDGMETDKWRKTWLRGIDMMKKIVDGRYHGYRVLAPWSDPLELRPDMAVDRPSRDWNRGNSGVRLK